MLAQLLALLAAAPPAPAAAPTTVSPLTVPAPARTGPIAATVDVASDDESATRDFVAIWPATAYQSGYDGHVTLSCKVDTHGLAEHCDVASEAPRNRGFGRAALELRPTFKLQPAAGPDGQPVTAVMLLNITFKAPKKYVVGTEGERSEIRSMHDTEAMIRASTSVAGNPLAMRDVTMVDDPVWSQAASFDDLAQAYPAQAHGAEGYAVAHCMVRRGGVEAGTLKDCQVIKETPHEMGFGKAALALAQKFRVDPAVVARAPHRSDLWVDIPIRFPPPAELAERAVMAPAWLLGLDPRAAPRVFPPEAAAQGLTTGRGVARCTVAADGTLAACAPEPGEPDGLGFSEAATTLAARMRMNLWSADGAPVRGGVVHIPIRLNLKGAGA